MDIISERERILLGYAPRDSLPGAVLSSQRQNSDVDFHDVFGGSLRRSSIYESRRNRSDSIDLRSRASRGREDSAESRRSGEKPVFGDVGGSSWRRELGDDFYSDIFHSSDSACSSPRIGDRDTLQSSPGSRVNSPNRSARIRLDPLFGGSSLPRFSLNHPAFGSHTQQNSAYRNEDDRSDAFSSPLSPNASSTGPFTSQSVAGHGDLRNNGYSSHRQNPLSRRNPSSFEGLPDTMEPAFRTVESLNGKSSSSLEDYISNRQFHFSIYKWAGKGVMLVMPSDSNERNESEGRLTRLPEMIVQEVELPSNCEYFSHVTKAFKSGTVTQEKSSDKKEDDYIAAAANGPELLKDDTNKTSDKCGNPSGKASVPCFDETSNVKSEFKFDAHGEQNHELKSLSQLFDDDADKLKDKPRGNKVKGKVTEFIRKFNQGGSPKRKGAFEMLVRRPKGEENRKEKDDELGDKSQWESGNISIPSFDIPKVMENQGIEKAEDEESSIGCYGLPSEERIEVLPPQSESTPQVLHNAACLEENILEDFEGYQVKLLPENLAEAAQSSPQDQIKNLDAMIRQWSSGKEGNIRSLLSTLQLVLWAESGWKQVPLVNIIEGASVKKAYQKALLCLHPDKLQQKAASSNQKYIAEKVFNILQEAWDHFSSIGEF